MRLTNETEIAVYIYIHDMSIVKTNIWPLKDHGGVLFLGMDNPVKSIEEWQVIGIEQIAKRKLNGNAKEVEAMDLNTLVLKFNDLKSKVSDEDKKTVELMNEVCKLLYLQVRMLATRQDLTFWYNESSLSVLKKIDKMLLNSDIGAK